MKQSLCLLACLLVAATAYAQDVDFGAFGDAGSLLGPAAPAARGAAPARGAVPPPAPPDRLVRLRETLTKAEVPMTKEQEAELNKLMDAEIPVMRRTIQTHGQQMMAARAATATPPASGPATAGPAAAGVPTTPQAQQAPPTAGQPPISGPAPGPPPTPGGPPPAAAAARGAAPAAGAPNAALLAAIAARGPAPPPSSRVPAEVLDALEVEMREMNDALFTKIASSPALNPTQQSVLTRMARTQIRARGGFDALRVAMEDAGAPFSEEQLPKVKALFEDQKKTRSDLAKESQGTPDPAKLKQLERDTLCRRGL